jgi:hypothetical protein
MKIATKAELVKEIRRLRRNSRTWAEMLRMEQAAVKFWKAKAGFNEELAKQNH